VKRSLSTLALMFLSMALTLHLTDTAVRHSQEAAVDHSKKVSERCLSYADVLALPSGGLGALVECEPSGVRLVTCLPGHAGSQSGLKVGDRIIAINGESTRGCNEPWAVNQLRGKIGTNVVLDVERGEGIWQRTFRTTVERKNIETEYSVYSRLHEDELVIRVLWLGPETTDQLAKHLSQVNDFQVDRVVLDLSNLSSGDINSLREAASLFLPEETVVAQYTTFGGKLTPVTTHGHQYTDQLHEVRVGPYTAKVGEAFARALSDNLDVMLTGSETAGLGTIDGRTIRSRASKRNVGLELFDAQGQAIDGNPLKPDFWSWSNLLSPVSSGLE